jgi:putative transposase
MRKGVGLGHQPELTGGGLIRSLGGWSQVIARRRSGKKEEGDDGYWGAVIFVHAILKETKEGNSRSSS